MYFKLSLRNVKRSVKDYAIYFITITFAVCVFYSFNSLSAQQAMLDLSSSQREIVKHLVRIIAVISVFISVVLAFLIIFANSFLIRRRKKELGMYMTLGMSKYNISRILIMETLLIGIISLVAGLALGSLLSQGLSILTAAMFQVDMKAYTFVFSMDAMIKTIIYFGIIYLVVMLFNVVIINRYKLIDLLTASRKNQKMRIRKTSTSIAVFTFSLLMLGTAYGIMLKFGLFKSINLVWTSVGIGALGTLLFFLSLSGFLITLLKQNKRFYFKDINMFVLRQINSKVNSTFISMTMICLMLFFTIGVLSTGFGLKNSLENNLDLETPYDASLLYHVDENHPNTELFEKLGVKQYGDYVVFNKYQAKKAPKAFLGNYADSKSRKVLQANTKPMTIIKQSKYNELMRLQNKQPIALGHNEVLFLTNVDVLKPTLKQMTAKQEKVTINGQVYDVSPAGYQLLSTSTTAYSNEILTAVLPDAGVKNLQKTERVLDIQYNGHSKAKDQALLKKVQTFNESNMNENGSQIYLLGMTKTAVYEQATGTSTMVVYIGIYLGIVFLISSAAILSLQQLSEANDNMERYSMLKKIGVTNRSINKSIFRQILIYFMMPLSLAVVHSIFGIKVVNDALQVVGKASVLFPAFLTAAIIIIVYGAYFLATYSGYKSIVK